MTFRWKLASALASLSAVAIGVCAVTAYAVTDRHLAGEIDLSLQQAATVIARAGPGVAEGGQAPAPAAGPPGTGRPPAQQPPPRTPLGVLALVAIQRVDAAGNVVSTNGGVELPVTASVRGVAAEGGTPVTFTAESDGQPYRIEAVPVPAGGALELGRDLAENDALLSTLRWLFALVGLSVILLAAAAGWLIAGRIARRLTRLTVSAEQVAETGQLQRPVEGSGDDEVGRLARAFGSMMESLARSREQQHALVQNAEHELRTPLTSMRTNIDLLTRHRDLPAGSKATVLQDLDTELEELTALVNELVELASDRRETEPLAPVHLGELARRVGDRMRSRTGREVVVDADGTVVDGVVRDLERAMTNLVDNAAKFSPTGSPIELVVQAGRVEVRDRGAGVPAADAPHVFDRFYRADAAWSEPGSGLGLAIVRRVAEMHGGTVFAAPREGGGSLIGFSVPVSR